MRALRCLALAVAWAACPLAASAQITDPNAAIVYLRKTCDGSLPNCVTRFVDVTNFVNQRKPTAEAPLLVDIGPGDFRSNFPARLECHIPAFPDAPAPSAGIGYTTFRGAGRDQTIIGSLGGYWLNTSLWIDACDELVFQDLTLRADSVATQAHAVLWRNGGSSTWVNTTLSGPQTGWYDVCHHFQPGGAGLIVVPPPPPEYVNTTPLSRHYFFGSRVESRGDSAAATSFSSAYIATCAENWFYGSEIVARATSPGVVGAVSAVELSGTGDVRVFASTLRTEIASTATQVESAYGARLALFTGNGESESPGEERFHAHGSTIEVDTSPVAGVPAIGIASGARTATGAGGLPNPPSLTHTLDTSFRLQGGSNAVARLLVVAEDGVPEEDLVMPMVMSPFRWPAAAALPNLTPASGGTIPSGADLVVETDCTASGRCGYAPGSCPAGEQCDHPHLMAYNPSCPSRWFDTTTGSCRLD